LRFKELDIVKTLVDFPKEAIKKGEFGAIVAVFANPNEAYEVEFVNDDGTTKAMITILSEQIEKI
jgi:hypothetical protein